MNLSPLAGLPAPRSLLVDVSALVTAYFTGKPDPQVASQRIIFGTSGHRGSSFDLSFNENHILAITQAICLYRLRRGTTGPLFLGMDTHALSVPACASALEVLAANGIEVMLAQGDEYTPTPVISHAILKWNQGLKTGFADGIVITPSHNPPGDGGFKYNPSDGGPAGTGVTKWIEQKANELLEAKLRPVKRISLEKAREAVTTHRHDYLTPYIADLGNVVNLKAVHEAGLHLGVDPLGGAGVHYWPRIAELYDLDLTVTNDLVDPQFGFMTVDGDGKIRMDPSSSWAMERLVALKDKFDLAFACDTDHDRHGIVTRAEGLLPPDHYLCAALVHLSRHRPDWNPLASVGKTMVSSRMVDRAAAQGGWTLYEVPVGFKWFAAGLLDGSLVFAGEESAGATFSRFDGTVWTTDKDGFIPTLLAAEILAVNGRDPGEIYGNLTKEFGPCYYERVENPAPISQRTRLAAIRAQDLPITELAGEKVLSVLTAAPGNEAPFQGLRVSAASGWFAVRPSGTEDIIKVYGESLKSADHLKLILEEAQRTVASFLKNTV